jgi:glycine/D-amino acid oxidase-like deaminating enzyme
MFARAPDALIVGDGIISLATAIALARSGATCCVLGRTVTGAASPASAGLLAPSIGDAEPTFRALMRASRDRYPEWVEWLVDRTGTDIVLNRLGIIELAASELTDRTGGYELDANALRALEPDLSHSGRATLFRDDGYVNNLQLLTALRIAARAEPRIELMSNRVLAVSPRRNECAITTDDGQQLTAAVAIIAAGAWSATIRGLPRVIPIAPVRGQMLQLRDCSLSHAISLDGAYLVPRGNCVLVGSTIERVGFDSVTTPEGLAKLRRAAATAIPRLDSAQVHSAWAGLRPMSEDGKPILGRDPELPSVVYACGHGKNGILLAPITAECIAAIVCQVAPPFDVGPLGIERFSQRTNPAPAA